MNTIKVKNVELGTGIPKIAIPIVGKNFEELRKEVVLLKELPADVVEWRVDFLDEIADVAAVKRVAGELRKLLPDKPILFTCRTRKEGGEKEISSADYELLNHELIKSGVIDLVDVELFSGDDTVHSIVAAAHRYGVKVIMSSHDFQQTPSAETIIKRLCTMQDHGADVSKIAVMPQTAADVLALLEATEQMKTTFADRPFITMSMSGKGVISRLTGELFGSALTFGSAEKASAPGQIKADRLAELLNFFHEQAGE